MTTSTTPDLLTLARERAAILMALDEATSVQIARLNRIEQQLDRYDWRQVLAATKAARAEREAAAKISAA